MRFIPLASETSIGAMDPRNSEGMKEETKEMRAVALYASGCTRRIWTERRQSAGARNWTCEGVGVEWGGKIRERENVGEI